MVYNWDGKEADCYRLYVAEKKNLEEVMEYWELRGFTPSKRAFQTQFKRWDFPSKQNPAHKNPALIARVKGLWEKNVMQKDMLETLRNEGFQINDRELMRLRLRFGWMLRDSSGRVPKRKENDDGSAQKVKKTKEQEVVPDNGLINQLTNATLQEECSSTEEDFEANEEQEQTPLGVAKQNVRSEPPTLDPEELLRRQLRQEQLQRESAEKWRARKRRRRTRGWAGLPADAPGEPPRFPSETTLDESKAYLSLDNKLYRQVREQFQRICEEQGVIKKTIAGPEKWARIKEQLIQENSHLSTVFQQDTEARQQNSTMTTPSNLKALSLDVICMDVTKRMRTLDSRMGIPEAKNTLGLNPAQTRDVRTAFYNKLKVDHFTNKLEAGDQHWNELKQAWIQESELLTRILAIGDVDPKYAEKLKAVEVLARDVMKRLRNENCQKDPSRRKQVNQGPGPGPAPPSVLPHASNIHLKSQQKATNHSPLPSNNTPLPRNSSSDFQIDPTLLLAPSDPPAIPTSSHDISQHRPRVHHNPYILSPQFFTGVPLPIYFRLHPHSNTSMPNKTVWLGIMQAGTVSELRNLAMREHPGTVVMKVEGVVTHKMQGQLDREITITIDDEDELSAYLEHVADGKATFLVLLGMQGGGYV
ncbi:hypothetical protein K505DRAFT_415691 [Melanomma pulvis-pyrius CBS 109.77]|uniref:Uncharacterized protein n=1 Tax=Melanomma pulvis-pyrius CBS 109.77 TaxID=1314802 RepID=A0A6A6XJ82_9PLEO|nr:hypothetical protein K505DRAFT_415691 [Melanomma pulvis-pyrius CBS 109.77]